MAESKREPCECTWPNGVKSKKKPKVEFDERVQADLEKKKVKLEGRAEATFDPELDAILSEIRETNGEEPKKDTIQMGEAQWVPDMKVAREVLRRMARRAGVRFTTKVSKEMGNSIGRIFWDPGSIYVQLDGAKLYFAPMRRSRVGRALGTAPWEIPLAKPDLIKSGGDVIHKVLSPKQRKQRGAK